MAISKEAFLALKSNIQVKEVSIPGTDQTIHIKELSGADRSEFESSVLKGVDAKGNPIVDISNQQLKLLIVALCDEKGERLFKKADMETLAQLPASVLDHLHAEVQNFADIGHKNPNKAFEEAEKN